LSLREIVKPGWHPRKSAKKNGKKKRCKRLERKLLRDSSQKFKESLRGTRMNSEGLKKDIKVNLEAKKRK
jgi:hypothetical protein